MKNMRNALSDLFATGEDVVIVTENDKKIGGKLYPQKGGKFLLKSAKGVERILWLSEMRFIGQDGFEITKLKGADGSPSIMRTDNTQLIDTLRNYSKPKIELIESTPKEIWLSDKVKDCENKIKYWKERATLSEGLVKNKVNLKDTVDKINLKYGVCGDPYMFENFDLQLFNIGNAGKNRLFRRSPYEEFTILTHKNGAKAMFQDLYTLYFAG